MSDTFSWENRKVTMVQATSNIGTDSSISEVGLTSRKRTRPIKFCSCSSDDDDEIELVNGAGKQKMLDTPKFTHSLREMHIPTLENTEENEESHSVSLMNVKNEPQSPDFEEKTEFAMFTRVFQYLENIQKDLKILKAEQKKIQCQLAEITNKKEPISILPTGISIPVETDEDLLRLNAKLKEDKTLTLALARYLCGASTGKTISSFILNICKRVLSKTVASQYSRLGRKGKKRFELVDEVYKAILTAASLKFTEAPMEDFAEKFGRVLASSIDWDGTRSKNNSGSS